MVNIVPYLLDTLAYVGIFAILAISLNLEAGFTRLINFGKVAFFAIGAYTSALLTLNGIPFLAAWGAAIVMAALAGYLISIPTLRLREDYFAIVTIAFGEILRLFFVNEIWLTNGTNGLRGIPRPFQALIPEAYSAFYVGLIMLSLLICYVTAQKLIRSPFGRVLKAIREDELAAQALGKNIFIFKTKTLIIGSGMAGVSGALFAHYLTFIAPDMFLPMMTFSVWIMIVVGGRGNHLGAVFGAVIVQFLERGTRFLKDVATFPVEPSNVRLIVIGLILILFTIYNPEGLLKEKSEESYITLPQTQPKEQ